MQRITRNTLLEYIPHKIRVEKHVNSERIYKINSFSGKINKIVYVCEREIRAKDNFALQFALEKSNELRLPLKIIHPKINFEHKPKQIFTENQISQAQKSFEKLKTDFQIVDEVTEKDTKFSLVITDFNPILKRDYSKCSECEIYEIDGHNIVPARFVSDKQEYSAATLRRKIYLNIHPFFTEFENHISEQVEADCVLNDFIKNKLPYYAKDKNKPSADILSGLSKYINLGFISSQRIALEIIKSSVSRENKETFLEELITRKELADNFCLYSKNFKDFSGVPNWAKMSLEYHKHDIRTYNYSVENLEKAETHDILWNATQNQLMQTGTIHGYLRMYWAKKISEWTMTKEQALETAIYLNDKYAYDSPSSNGYVGILWALGGLHDRAFRDYSTTGKVRRMTYNSIKNKFDISGYINKYAEL